MTQDVTPLPLLRLPVTPDWASPTAAAGASALCALAADAALAWLSRHGLPWRALRQADRALRIGQVQLILLDTLPPVGDVVEVLAVGPHDDGLDLVLRCTHGHREVARARVAWTLSGESPAAVVPVTAPLADLPPVSIIGVMGSAQCDQAGHVNVQTFMDLADAGLIALSRRVGMAPRAGRLRMQETRIVFRAELFSGDVVLVCSGVRGRDEAHGGDVASVHALVCEATGQVACVVETRARASVPGSTAAPAIEAAAGPPWSELAGPWAALPGLKPLQGERAPAEPGHLAVETCRETIDSWDTDAEGELTPRALVRWCSTAARQFLGHIGLDGTRMARDRVTVAAVDYLIRLHQPPRLGANIVFRTSLLDAGAKTLRFCHHLCEAHTGQVWASIEIVGVMFDLQARKAMEIPADVRARLAQWAV